MAAGFSALVHRVTFWMKGTSGILKAGCGYPKPVPVSIWGEGIFSQNIWPQPRGRGGWQAQRGVTGTHRYHFRASTNSGNSFLPWLGVTGFTFILRDTFTLTRGPEENLGCLVSHIYKGGGTCHTVLLSCWWKLRILQMSLAWPDYSVMPRS